MKLRHLVLCLSLLVVLFSCEVNTMYNARSYFKAAQERPLSNQGRPNSQAVEEYTKTIKKCGIIITERKKGASLEEAYFLMAKALYFKGNSAFQAKDQFENILLLFPKSRYVPESHLFIARILREINQKKEAERRMEEFIRNPRFTREHPKALFLMADFAIKDKDYIKAQYYLERIIKEYPKTKEYREAYFLFGKNYFEQKDYARSLEAFEKMQNARGIDKQLKMDGRYYIGLNQLELKQTDKAFKTAKSLVKNETRLDKIPLVRLLKARTQFALGDSVAAKEEIDYITKNFMRTESSAAAYYYLAEHQYYQAGETAKAVASYNRVRTEFTGSALAVEGQNKATALGKVNPPANLNSESNLNQFLDHHYNAAESFLGALALPDSAISRYQRVIAEKQVLAVRLDSLNVKLNSDRTALDSLNALIAANPEPIDSLVASIPDSLAEDLEQQALTDTLLTRADNSQDSLALDLNQQKSKLESETTALQNRIDKLTETLDRFEKEITPFCLFAIGSVLNDYYPEDKRNRETLVSMQQDFMDNKYTKALAALQNGQPIRLIDPREERQEAKLDSLFGVLSTQPDSALVALEELTESEYPGVKVAANYRLGWFYSFEAIDTLKAVPYLKAVLDDPNAGDYATVTRRFYDGRQFLLREILLDVVTDADSNAVTVGDTLRTWRFPTPAEIFSSLPDSLQIYRGIPPLVDSLSKDLQNNTPPAEPGPLPEVEKPIDQQTENPKDAIKEEAPLE